jgi:hypothetical protein
MNIKLFVMIIISIFNTNVLCKEKYNIRSHYYTRRFLGSSGSTGIDDDTRRFLGSSGSTGIDDSLL